MKALMKRLAALVVVAALAYGAIASGSLDYAEGFQYGMEGHPIMVWRTNNEPWNRAYMMGWEDGLAVFVDQVEKASASL